MEKSKKWFDDDCVKLRSEVRKKGREKHWSPHDTLLRLKYHEKLKEFKKICQSKRYFFFQDKLEEIESALGDSKSFWEKWKHFGEIDTNKSDIKIPCDKLYSHFSNLHKDTSKDEIIELETTTDTGKNNEKLNRPFSKKRV